MVKKAKIELFKKRHQTIFQMAFLVLFGISNTVNHALQSETSSNFNYKKKLLLYGGTATAIIAAGCAIYPKEANYLIKTTAQELFKPATAKIVSNTATHIINSLTNHHYVLLGANIGMIALTFFATNQRVNKEQTSKTLSQADFLRLLNKWGRNPIQTNSKEILIKLLNKMASNESSKPDHFRARLEAYKKAYQKLRFGKSWNIEMTTAIPNILKQTKKIIDFLEKNDGQANPDALNILITNLKESYEQLSNQLKSLKESDLSKGDEGIAKALKEDLEFLIKQASAQMKFEESEQEDTKISENELYPTLEPISQEKKIAETFQEASDYLNNDKKSPSNHRKNRLSLTPQEPLFEKFSKVCKLLQKLKSLNQLNEQEKNDRDAFISKVNKKKQKLDKWLAQEAANKESAKRIITSTNFWVVKDYCKKNELMDFAKKNYRIKEPPKRLFFHLHKDKGDLPAYYKAENFLYRYKIYITPNTKKDLYVFLEALKREPALMEKIDIIEIFKKLPYDANGTLETSKLIKNKEIRGIGPDKSTVKKIYPGPLLRIIIKSKNKDKARAQHVLDMIYQIGQNYQITGANLKLPETVQINDLISYRQGTIFNRVSHPNLFNGPHYRYESNRFSDFLEKTKANYANILFDSKEYVLLLFKKNININRTLASQPGKELALLDEHYGEEYCKRLESSKLEEEDPDFRLKNPAEIEIKG